MDTALTAGRAQFAFTIMFHYLFPVLTMGLGVLIAALKTLQLRHGDLVYGDAARFWALVSVNLGDCAANRGLRVHG